MRLSVYTKKTFVIPRDSIGSDSKQLPGITLIFTKGRYKLVASCEADFKVGATVHT